jgi:HK97 gp10 family phage protein
VTEYARVAGLQELRAAMLQLPKRLDRRVLNAALMAGARLIAQDAEGRAPVLQQPDPRRRAGTVRRNIRARPVRPFAGRDATVIVSVRQLSKKQIGAFKKKFLVHNSRAARSANNPNDPFYWRFLEFGTSKMPARPFLRPAFAAQREAALAAFRQRMSERLIVEAQRLNRSPRR